ncbi:hypothetical protein AAHA92_01787 [Salvia divinorum]|uniref:Uncharacterized protein n=1 Tax=Salvia divinorum TaxID=28513 RepID=A0ABD1IBP8_SALDI
MPPVDLENLVSACAGGGCIDSKVTCETLAGDNDGDNTSDEEGVVVVAADPDFPPESFWLSKDAEYDWFEHHTFFERRDSGRGGTSLTAEPQSNSSSRRFSFSRKSKAALLGLPKTQKATYVDPKRRPCSKPVAVRLFPKRSEPAGKSGVPVEPGSPKVSCIGRVRSKRRRRSGSLRRREKAAEKSRSGGGEKVEKGEKKQKAGFYTKVIGMFRSKRSRSKKAPRSGSRRAADETKAAAGSELQQRWSADSRVREMAGEGARESEPPGLGGMNRFASGRRSASWAAEDFSETVSGSDRHVGVVSWS